MARSNATGMSCDDESMPRAIAFLFLSAIAIAQPERWPAALEQDVHSQSWAAAERVGDALAAEIDAGRIFATFAGSGEEARVRNLFADALEHNGKTAEARVQRCLARQIPEPQPEADCADRAARERDRRIAHLKADVLATEVKIPASFPVPRNERVTIVAFSASWCAPCVKELELLRKFDHPRAQVVMLDVDQLSSEQKAAFVPRRSLLGPEVPRLYVLDREGRIRFYLLGFDNDAFFAEKLTWMVDASR